MTDREPSRFSDTRKSDHITLPRAVALGLRDAMLCVVRAADQCGVSPQPILETVTALDAALAEPKKERAEVAPPARSGVDKCEIDSLTGEAYPTPQPDAKPEPVVVEQLFALAKLTVRRAADPDPWVWDRLSDDGTWTPFNPLIHGPDMWRLEQALRAALAEPEPTVKESLTVDHIWPIWGASENEVEAMMPRPAPSLEFLDGFRDGFRAAERFHGVRKEDWK